MKYRGKSFFLNYPLLRRLYNNRLSTIHTIYIGTYVGISENQVGSYYINLPTSKVDNGQFLLTNAKSSFGLRLYDLTFTFTGYVDKTPIEDCTFREFVELYAELYMSGEFEYSQEEMLEHVISNR